MYYKNGREVKVGDKVIGKDWTNSPFGGVIVNLVPALSAVCDIVVAPIIPTQCQVMKSSECLHYDDVFGPKPE